MPPRLAKKTDDNSTPALNKDTKSLIVSNYTEKSVVVTGDTISHSNELKKLGGKYNPNLKIGPGWIFSKTREPIIQKYIETGEIEPYKPIAAPKSDSFSFTHIFEDLKNAFKDDEDYNGKDVLETIRKIEEKYCTKVEAKKTVTSKVSPSLKEYHESDSE